MDRNDEVARSLEAADMYLRDAAVPMSTHGRFSAAIDALGCLCEAGIADDADKVLVAAWEDARYDPEKWPSEAQVTELVAHVVQVRGRQNSAG